jgi:DNA modification methylase
MEYKVLIGDVRESLLSLPDGSVNCVVTSPPYWGLRDYGTASWNGGDDSCDHSSAKMKSRYDYAMSETAPGTQKSKAAGTDGAKWLDVCPSCGAIKDDSQIGLEQTPEAFIDELVKVFCEVKRVLQDDGTLWLNIGDSYASYKDGKASPDSSRGDSTGTAVPKGSAANRMASSFAAHAIKNKDLVGIPWMLAFALRADGWYLRQDIIWHKPNPMPESVKDRCTKSHEYIFLLSKSPKYFFDHEAIKEPSANLGKTKIKFGGTKYGDSDDPKFATKSGNEYTDTGLRNKRDVWTIPTKPYKGAHFATFPKELIEPCILAGCPEGGTVLDPFAGSGTTLFVANKHGRNAIGCELNPEYVEIIHERMKEIIPSLFEAE